MPASRKLEPVEGAAGRNFTAMDRRVQDLEDLPLTTARLVTVDLATGDNRVRHGLRRARGAIVVRISAAVSLYDADDADPAYWIVNASAPATATFLFF